MTSFIQIPHEDIISFLKSYNQIISNDKKQNYINAWNLLTSNNVSEAPVSIVDYLIALNLSINNIIFRIKYMLKIQHGNCWHQEL